MRILGPWTLALEHLAVERMINDGSYEEFLNKRYENWSQNNELMKSSSLESIYENVKLKDINPEPQSGRQEYLENLLNSFIE